MTDAQNFQAAPRFFNVEQKQSDEHSALLDRPDDIDSPRDPVVVRKPQSVFFHFPLLTEQTEVVKHQNKQDARQIN